MKKVLSIVFALITMVSYSNKDWGPTGHRVTGEIAAKYLSKSVKTKIKKLLKGYSLAYVSTYADEVKSDKRFNKFYTWHYVNMPLDKTYDTSEKNPKGDLITGINYCVEVLKDVKASDEDKRFYLKMLVHLMGDLHQPLHVGKEHDHGGNKIKVKWHHYMSNLHRVWDEDLIDKWDMSYTELADNEEVLDKTQIEAIKKGSVVDWLHDTHKITKKVYADAEGKKSLRYKYSYKWMPVVKKQLQKGGIRLAKLLNDIFK